MTETYNRIADKRNIREAGSEWDSSIDFAPSSNTYKLLTALLSENDRIDTELEEIYEQQHIDSATGDDLDQFGNLANVDRKTGESDNEFRARIKANVRAATMSSTFDEFTQFVASILSTSTKNISVNTNFDLNTATVSVFANGQLYDDTNLTNSEIKELFGSGVPAGHAVDVNEYGTFKLKADGDPDTAENGLTSDKSSKGGTLFTPLV